MLQGGLFRLRLAIASRSRIGSQILSLEAKIRDSTSSWKGTSPSPLNSSGPDTRIAEDPLKRIRKSAAINSLAAKCSLDLNSLDLPGWGPKTRAELEIQLCVEHLKSHCEPSVVDFGRKLQNVINARYLESNKNANDGDCEQHNRGRKIVLSVREILLTLARASTNSTPGQQYNNLILQATQISTSGRIHKADKTSSHVRRSSEGEGGRRRRSGKRRDPARVGRFRGLRRQRLFFRHFQGAGPGNFRREQEVYVQERTAFQREGSEREKSQLLPPLTWNTPGTGQSHQSQREATAMRLLQSLTSARVSSLGTDGFKAVLKTPTRVHMKKPFVVADRVDFYGDALTALMERKAVALQVPTPPWPPLPDTVWWSDLGCNDVGRQYGWRRRASLRLHFRRSRSHFQNLRLRSGPVQEYLIIDLVQAVDNLVDQSPKHHQGPVGRHSIHRRRRIDSGR